MTRYRCIECRKVQDADGRCVLCGGKLKAITVHGLRARTIISNPKTKVRDDKHKK